MNDRYEELDSLRGIASMSVFFGHITLIPKMTILTILTTLYFPLNMFFNGGASVIFFFTLSGFVLFLPYSNGGKLAYRHYMIKRFFRIFIPYLIAIILTIGACLLLSKGGIKGLSNWFNGSWKYPITLHDLVDHLVLIGNFNSDEFDDVIWSLVQEMRISIIFPFLALIINRPNWKGPFLTCLGLLIVSGLNNTFNWQNSYGFRTSIFNTFEYIPMFMIGGYCAKYLNKLISLYSHLTSSLKVLVWLAAYLFFNFHGIMISIADYLRIYSFETIAGDYSIVVGSILIIIITLSSKRVQRFLLVMPLRFLGRVSYSLYLYHLPVLFSLVYLFYYSIPLWLILAISFPISLLIANLSWVFIEKPSIKYGKVVISRMMFLSNKSKLIKIMK